MRLEIQRQKTPAVQNNADKFMKDSSHQDHAQILVERDVEELQAMGLTKEEIVERMAKKGHLKTETDRKILEGTFQKNRVKENLELYKQRTQKKARQKMMTDYFVRQMEQTPQTKVAFKKKYY